MSKTSPTSVLKTIVDRSDRMCCETVKNENILYFDVVTFLSSVKTRLCDTIVFNNIHESIGPAIFQNVADQTYPSV